MKSTILLILPIAAFVLLLSSGCSVLGPSSGVALTGGDAAEHARVPNAVALQASEGDRLQVHMGNDVVLDLIFHQLVLPDERSILEDIVDQGKETDSGWSIQPGDRIRLQESGGEEVTGVLLGGATTELWYCLPGEKRIRKVPFRDLTSVRSGTVGFQGGYLRKINEGQLPLIYDIKGTLAGDSMRIPVRNADMIHRPQSSPAAAEVISGIHKVHDALFTLKIIGLLLIIGVAIAAGAGG